MKFFLKERRRSSGEEDRATKPHAFRFDIRLIMIASVCLGRHHALRRKLLKTHRDSV